MTAITQNMKFRHMRFRISLIKFDDKYGVFKAAMKYKTNRQYVCRRKNRYDSSLNSLRDRSKRLRSRPNQRSSEEIKLISDMRRR